MSERVSRRTLLQTVSLGTVGGLAGCLRLTTTGESSTERSTPTAGSTDVPEPTQTETPSLFGTGPDWTIDEWSSDIVTFDGMFYLSTWVSKRLLAVQPDGTVAWESDQLGKFKRNSLAVTDSMLVGCGYGGQITAVDRASGDLLWNFTEGQYDSWSAKPLVTDRHVIGVNQGDTEDTNDAFVVYVLDRASGEVVDTIEYTDLNSPISSLGVIDGSLYVASFNFLDLYTLDTRSQITSYDDFLYGSSHVRDGDLFVATSSNVYRYQLSESSHSQVWGATLRGSIGDLRFVSDGILANGEAGVFKIGYDGEQQWWGETDAYIDRPAVVGDYVFTLDRYHQLRAFDFGSGELSAETTLPSEGLPLAPITSVGQTLLVGLNPLIAYDIPSS